MDSKKELYPHLENIADLLWLSQFTGIKSVAIVEELKEEIEDTPHKPKIEEDKEQEIPAEPHDTSDQEIHTNDQVQESQSKQKSAKVFQSPKKLALSNYRAWEKAFKYINLKQPSKNKFELDEDKTVENIASSKVFDLVFKRLDEKSFLLTIVIDRSETMELWDELVKNFEHMLYTMGVFARISIYYWDTKERTPQLYYDRGLKREVGEHNIVTDGHRNLIWVMSDCLAPSWRSAEAFKSIERWSKNSLTSIMQMFPKEMWTGTMLFKGNDVQLSTNTFNPYNKKLNTNLYRKEENSLKIPIVSFDPYALQSWAKVVINARGNSISGMEFASLDFDYVGHTPPNEITTDMRMKRFYSQASPTAQELAFYMSTLPVDFQVTRLLQELKVPKSNQSHVAEVFLGGLIERIKKDDRIKYEFYPEIRQELNANISADEAYDIMDEMSGFVSEHLGIGFDFSALISDPNGAFEGEFALSEESIAFAKLASEVLKRRGGVGIEVAERIDGLVESNNLNDKSKKALIDYIKAVEIENGKINHNGRVLLPINYILNSRYMILEVLGTGGAYNTYLAKDLKLNVNTVVEEFNIYGFSYLLSYKEKALKYKKIFHPNIVEIIDFIETNKTFYSIRRYIEGKLLSSIKSSLEKDIIRIGIDILDALEYIQKNKLQHRDIHPKNIIVDNQLKPYLIDYLDNQKTEMFILGNNGKNVNENTQIIYEVACIMSSMISQEVSIGMYIYKFDNEFREKYSNNIINTLILGLRKEIHDFKEFIDRLNGIIEEWVDFGFKIKYLYEKLFNYDMDKMVYYFSKQSNQYRSNTRKKTIENWLKGKTKKPNGFATAFSEFKINEYIFKDELLFPFDAFKNWSLKKFKERVDDYLIESNHLEKNKVFTEEDITLLPINYIIGYKYKILKILGRGSFGVVYLVRDIESNNLLVIKELFLINHSFRVKNFSIQNRDEIKEFIFKIQEDVKKEVNVFSKIKHKNIVKFYGYLSENNTIYSIMEYLDGVDLERYINNDSFNEEKAKNLLKQIISGLKEIHKKDIIHRDIKPSNIILTKNGIYKLIDFTTSKILIDDKTNAVTGIGTRIYSSPELEQSNGKIDKNSDIYSFGITMIKILSTKEIELPNVVDRFYNNNGFQNIINQLNINDKFKYILKKMTELKVEDRYQSVEEIEEDLNAEETLAEHTNESIRLNKEILPIGTILKDIYKIINIIGKDEFYITYKVQDIFNKFFIMTELFIEEICSRDNYNVNINQNQKEDFSLLKKQEYTYLQNLMKIDNKNIVGISKFFSENNTIYIVQEYIDGIDLQTLYLKNQEKFDEEKAKDLILQLSNGLKIIHSLGILHNQISPSNILKINKTYKLIDFSVLNNKSNLGLVVLPPFSPLESYSESTIKGAYGDIYSLGITIFTLLKKDKQIPTSIDRQVMVFVENNNDALYEEIDLLEASNKFKNILKKMVSIKSKDRFQSMEEIELEISKIMSTGYIEKDNLEINENFTIEFTTSLFDVSKEERLFNKATYGQSVLLLWLRKELPNTIKMEDMAIADWGWYSYIECENEKYMVGSNMLDYKKKKDKYRWSFFMQKEEKSFFQKMKEKISVPIVSRNSCLLEVKDIFMREKSFENIELVKSE